MSRVLPFAAVVAAIFATSCVPKAVVLTDDVPEAKVKNAEGKWVKNQPTPPAPAVAANAAAPQPAAAAPAPAKKPWFSARNPITGAPVNNLAPEAPKVAQNPPAPAAAPAPPAAEKKHWWQKSGDAGASQGAPVMAGRKSGSFRKKAQDPAAAGQAVTQTPPAPPKKGWSLFHPKAEVVPEPAVAQNPPVKDKQTAPKKSDPVAEESAPPMPRGKGPALADDNIRMPNMLNLPGEGEFRSTNPTAPKDPNGNAVISRPPTDPPSRVKPEEKKD